MTSHNRNPKAPPPVDEPAADPMLGEPIEEAQAANGSAPADEEAQTQGIMQNVLLTPADYLPDHDRTWPTRAIASQPQGFRLMLGTVSGVAHGSERREGEYKGKKLMSVWLHGTFVGVVRATGELIEAVSAILPQAYALKIERQLKEGGEGARVQVDCDIGLEATGRTIPYKWVCADYGESKEREDALALARKGQARLARPQARIAAPGK